MIHFILNNEPIQTELSSGITLLDFIRYHQHLKGTKIGCREGDCGACTILVGTLGNNQMKYRSMTSCLMPLANANGKHIVTVEGINVQDLSPVQQAVVEEGGTQCGFCTVGFIVSLTGYCMDNQTANYPNAIKAIDGNICRCTGYKSLERACQHIVKDLQDKPEENHMDWLVKQGFLPTYFKNIPDQLESLHQNILFDVKPLKKQGSLPVGGGTDLYVQRPEEMIYSDTVNLFDNQEFKSIDLVDDFIYIGAEVTATDLAESDLLKTYLPNLENDMKWVSSTPIRNMGTLAGNLVNASPIGDLTIYFLALNADLILLENETERIIALNDFYLGYKQKDLKENEWVKGIRFQLPNEPMMFNFEKVCKREFLDIASVNTAISLVLENDQIKSAHVAAGGVNPIPCYLQKTSAFLIGKSLEKEVVIEAAKIMDSEIAPISDARGSEAYKRLLLRQLFYGHFLNLFPSIFSLKSLV